MEAVAGSRRAHRHGRMAPGGAGGRDRRGVAVMTENGECMATGAGGRRAVRVLPGPVPRPGESPGSAGIVCRGGA